MAIEKKDKSLWKIFFEGLKIYCYNFPKFFMYMAFPILGQLLGLILVFGLSFWYSQSLPELIEKYPAFNNFSTIILTVILVTVPGLLIWAKAFWDYLVAYGALNSMTEGALTTGKVYDFSAHRAVVTKRTFSFIVLWFLFSIFTLFSVIPFFWVIGAIFFVYFVFIFQVFTFEKGVSPLGCFKRSLQLVKGNYVRTLILMTILGVITYYLLTLGVSVLFDLVKLTDILASIFEGWVSTLPIDQFNNMYSNFNVALTPIALAKGFVGNIIFFIVAGFTLPLRSICWTLWYKNLNTDTEKTAKKTTKPKSKTTVIKKVSVKKSDKTPKPFKIEKREIDPEIIRRARMDDDQY